MGKLTFTIFVTEECNLRCNYCYVKKKTSSMDTNTANDCLDFINQIVEKEENLENEIRIIYHGGEPLLNFNIIVFLTKELSSNYGTRVSYRITINGTIFSEEIYQFLMKYNFGISISIDGEQKSNDINRYDRNGKSVYQKVMESLKYFSANNYEVRVRMTVNELNVGMFADNFIYLYKMGYRTISYALDQFNRRWSKSNLNTFRKELISVIDYLKEKDSAYLYHYLEGIKESEFRNLVCNVGAKSLVIAADGTIFPCLLTVGDKSFNIGNVSNGLDYDNIAYFDKINSSEIVGCKECQAKGICRGNVCKIKNCIECGDYYIPSYINCYLMRLYRDIVKQYGSNN